MEKKQKYEASLYINANKNNVEFIGNVSANSKKALKQAAREHARSWNKHLFGRICIVIDSTSALIELYENPNV